jgi:hypothetical protein
MVKFKIAGFIAVLFTLISCAKKEEIYDADLLMYSDYLEYIKVAARGQKAVMNTFGVDRDINYYFKEFPEQNIRFLIFIDKKLNQQYAIFYGNILEKKKLAVQKAEAVNGLNLRGAKFNAEVLANYLKIEEFIEGRFEKNIKKIVIGYEMGGAVANMVVASLIENSKFKKDEFEVITFSTIPFQTGLSVTYDNKNIIMEGDENAFLKTKCCSQIEGSTFIISAPKEKQVDKITAYQASIKSLHL